MLNSIKTAIGQFFEDDCMTLAASLAYYTLFAMPPLLFLLVTVVSLGMQASFESDVAELRAKEFLQLQAANLIGNSAAAAEIGNIIEQSRPQSGAWWKSLLSLAGVVVGSTGLVSSLQASLNRVWRVKPADGAFAKRFFIKRLLSLAMILGFGFVLLVSFVVSTMLRFFSQSVMSYFGIDGGATMAVNHIVTFATTWVLFTAIFKFMPDALVDWSHALLGGLITVILFTLGRIALFYYLTASDPAAKLGSAAGSLVIILLWVYYSSICLLLGAELTANFDPREATPEVGAARIHEIEEAAVSESACD